MKILKINPDLYSALSWSLLTLGATQLAFVLGGPIVLLIATCCCAVLFLFFLTKVEHPARRLRKQMIRRYLLATVFLLVGDSLYVYLVFLKAGQWPVIFLGAKMLVFIMPLLITFPFLRKPVHVTR